MVHGADSVRQNLAGEHAGATLLDATLNADRFTTRGGFSMAMGYTPSGGAVTHTMVTTQFELDGFRVVRTLGVVRGIVVRSRSIFGTIGASLQTILGGNITLLTQLCEKTRSDAFDLMLQHAAQLGGNAVVGARYDATEIMQGVTEVLAYGTAVLVEPVSHS
ncbi:MAG TPA: YbjQ family protein [Terriglobales bacterium]|nr:YbjQ family protein [Terriglobales bacterium]